MYVGDDRTTGQSDVGSSHDVFAVARAGLRRSDEQGNDQNPQGTKHRVDSSLKTDYWKDVERKSHLKWAIAIGAAVGLVALILLMSWLRPGVPKEVNILTGPENGRSYRWAERYADYVAAHGIRANVVATAGSGEILARLTDDTAPAVGFLQSGIEREVGAGESRARLESLGSLYFEPLWVFVSESSRIHELSELAGKRVFPGRPGSDARATSRALFTIFGLTDQVVVDPYEQLTPLEATDALVAGELDAVFLAGESGEASSRRLLDTSGIRAVSVRHADVYRRIQPDVAELLIPQGLLDLAHMVPHQDIQVIAPAINLVAREDLHPALVDLFLDAARRLQGGPSLLAERGTFPSEDYTSLPLSEHAKRYYDKGPSGLRKYLPFWLATWVDRLIIYVVPLLVVASSVFKGIPVIIQMKARLALRGFYRRIQLIENANDQKSNRDAYLQELDAIEDATRTIHIPQMHIAHYFEFRQYIHDLRSRLQDL
jgi:TRAP transporter TAXI family solute receptor